MSLPDAQRAVEPGSGFSHLVVRRTARFGGGPLHIYIEGDGTPFVRSDLVAFDPTPRRALMLDLLILDTADAVYLGRPCYFVQNDEACHPRYWTTARYSREVVDSMAAVIERLWLEAGKPPLVLIGHSGGGALAVLLADALPGTTSVITLAANLDPAAWARHHGYSPLVDSLTPMDVVLAQSVNELHVFGLEDDIVPVSLAAGYLESETRQRPNFLACFVQDCGHSGCWRDRWSDFVQQLLLNVAPVETCEVLQGGR